MDLLLIALLLLAVGGVVVVALGRVPGGLAATQEDAPPLEEPVSRAADLDRARFSLALRGYRMDQVDAVLDETRDLLAARDEEIARLRRRLAPGVDLSVYEPGDHGPAPDPDGVPLPAPHGDTVADPDSEQAPAQEPTADEASAHPSAAPSTDLSADPARSGSTS